MEHSGLIWEELWRIYTFSWDDQMGVEAMFVRGCTPFFAMYYEYYSLQYS